VQGDAVLLPGSGGQVIPSSLPSFSLAAAGGMHQVPEELLRFFDKICLTRQTKHIKRSHKWYLL
jgi:hypothetical protein